VEYLKVVLLGSAQAIFAKAKNVASMDTISKCYIFPSSIAKQPNMLELIALAILPVKFNICLQSGSLPLSSLTKGSFVWVGSSHTCTYLGSLKRLSRDKHSSLFGTINRGKGKDFLLTWTTEVNA
jgi:hypothetical protein